MQISRWVRISLLFALPLAMIGAAHPDFAVRLFDGNALKRFINVFINDEDIRYLDNLDTAVKDGDELSIIPAVAGG